MSRRVSTADRAIAPHDLTQEQKLAMLGIDPNDAVPAPIPAAAHGGPAPGMSKDSRHRRDTGAAETSRFMDMAVPFEPSPGAGGPLVAPTVVVAADGTMTPQAGTAVPDPYQSTQSGEALAYMNGIGADDLGDRPAGAATTHDPEDHPESNWRKCGVVTLKGLNVAYSILVSSVFVIQSIKRANGDSKLEGEYGSAAGLQNVFLSYLFAEDLFDLIRELGNPETSKVKKCVALPLGLGLGFVTMLSGFGLAELSLQKLPDPLTDPTLQGIILYSYAFYTFSTRAVATTHLSFQLYEGTSGLLYKASQCCRGDGCCSCSACCQSSQFVDYTPAHNLLKDLARFGGQIPDITEYRDDKAFIQEFYNRLKGENAVGITGVQKKFAPQYTAIESLLGLSKFVMTQGLIFAALMVTPPWLAVGEKGVRWVAGTDKKGWGWNWLSKSDQALNTAVWACTLSNIALYLRSAIDFQNSFATLFTKPRLERPGSSFCGAVNPAAKKLLATVFPLSLFLLTAYWSGSAFSETTREVEELYLESGLPCPFGQVANQTIFDQHNFMANQYNGNFRALLKPDAGWGLLSSPNLLQGLIAYLAAAAVNGRGSIRGISRFPGVKGWLNAGVKHDDKSTRHFQIDFQKRVDRGDPALSAKAQTSDLSTLDVITTAREGWMRSSQSDSKCSRVWSYLFSCGDFSYKASEPHDDIAAQPLPDVIANEALFAAEDGGTQAKTVTKDDKGCCDGAFSGCCDEDSSFTSVVRQFC